MAPGLKNRSILVLVGCAVIALVALPPGPPPYLEQRFETPERNAARAIADQMTVAAEQLRRLRWIEAESTELAAARAKGQDLVIGVPSSFASSEADDLRLRVEAELSRLGVEKPAVRLGVYAVKSMDELRVQDYGLTQLNVLSGRSHTEWYSEALAGQPYCITMRVSGYESMDDLSFPDWRPLGPDRFTNILGLCSFYARYGVPGAGTTAWLKQTLASYALRRTRADSPPARYSVGYQRAGLFGIPTGSRLGDEDVRVGSCTKGDVAVCETLIVSPETGATGSRFLNQVSREGLPFIGLNSGSNSTNPFHGAGEELLDHLEKTYGAEAFGQFWRSDRPMPEAFETAFGTPLGPWVRDWAREAYLGGQIGLGAAMTWGQIGLSLLWVAIAARFAIAKGRRRQVA